MARASLWHDGGTDQYAIAAIKPAQSRARQYSVIKRMRRRSPPSMVTSRIRLTDKVLRPKRWRCGMARQFTVVVLWVASLILTSILASAQTRRDPGMIMGTIISGNDIGFRPEGWN